MAIIAVCPECKKRYRLREDQQGQQIRCSNPTCSDAILVFAQSEADPAALTTAPRQPAVSRGTPAVDVADKPHVPRRTSYRTGTRFHKIQLVLSLFFCVVFLGATIIPFFMPREDTEELLVATGVLALFLAAYLVFVFLKLLPALHDLGLCVEVTEAGLELHRGQRRQSIRWEDIQTIWQRLTPQGRRVVATYWVRLNTGQTLIFTDHLDAVTELGETIQGEVARLQLPGAIARCREGGDMAFGPVRISSQGISKGGQTLDWEDIAQVTVALGALVIKKKQSLGPWWLRLGMSRVPNLDVFFGLVKEFHGA